MNRLRWVVLFSCLCILSAQADEECPIEQRIRELGDAIEARLSPLTSQIQQIMDQQKSGVTTTGVGFIPIGSEPKVPVYYEQMRFGGNWIVLMQRFDGSVRFNRTWAEYRDGFGVVGHEYWLGLERMHQLTKAASYEVAVELEDFEGNYKYERFDRFAVGPGTDRYPLELGAFSGTTGDSLSGHNGQGFATFDDDQFGCSNKYAKGGWWYYSGKCYGAFPTGIWKNERAWSSICWMKFSEADFKVPLRFVRMMIRPKEA